MIEINDSNYINIQYWMVSRLKLSGNELMIYAIVWGFSQDGKSCFEAGTKYLETFLGITRNTVKKALANLVDSGLIERKISERNGVSCDKYRVVGEGVKNWGGQKLTLSKNDPEGGQKLTGGGSKIDTPYIKERIKERIKENKDSKKGRFDPLQALKNAGVSEQVATDYIAYRKQKRTALSQTILETLQKQANLANITLEEAIRHSMCHNWQGFQADWYEKPKKKSLMEQMREMQSNRMRTIDGSITEVGNEHYITC